MAQCFDLLGRLVAPEPGHAVGLGMIDASEMTGRELRGVYTRTPPGCASGPRVASR